jgi:hypothetical protein
MLLTEDPGVLPNWRASAAIMETAFTDKFSDKVAELRNTDPLVDWSKVDKGQHEFRRLVKFISEGTARRRANRRQCMPK